jgi:hypothetical protein
MVEEDLDQYSARLPRAALSNCFLAFALLHSYKFSDEWVSDGTVLVGLICGSKRIPFNFKLA